MLKFPLHTTLHYIWNPSFIRKLNLQQQALELPKLNLSLPPYYSFLAYMHYDTYTVLFVICILLFPETGIL